MRPQLAFSFNPVQMILAEEREFSAPFWLIMGEPLNRVMLLGKTGLPTR
jgi:hypothetical protein